MTRYTLIAMVIIIPLACAVAPTFEHVATIGTGNTGEGELDFGWPWQIAFDSNGRLFVSDTGRCRIAILNPDFTFNSSIGGACNTDADKFRYTSGIAIDDQDRVFVSDYLNHRVQVYDVNGNHLVTIGGTAGSGEMEFSQPYGIAIGPCGRIYVGDGHEANCRVQVFNPDLTYNSTISGGCTANEGDLRYPRGLAIDHDGNVVVADYYNGRVQVFSPDAAHVRTITGPAEDALSAPSQVAVDDVGNIYVTSAGKDSVFVFSRTGELLTKLGSTGSNEGNFDYPEDVTIRDGLLYVTEYENHRIQVFRIIMPVQVATFETMPDVEYVGMIGTGNPGTLNSQLHFPTDVYVDNMGSIFVVDSSNNRVQVFDSNFHYLSTLGTTGVVGLGNDQFNAPTNVFVDDAGTIYVADRLNHRIQIFNEDYEYVSTLGTTNVSGNGDDQFTKPTKMAKDSAGNLYVIDSGNNRIKVFDPSLNLVDTMTGFWWPWGIFIDPSDRIFVSSSYNHQIKIFDSARQSIGTIGDGEKGSENDQFHFPYGVVIDPEGLIYVGDFNNKRVQVFSSDLAYLATIGLPGQEEEFQFKHPEGLALDSKGGLYVVDTHGHRVKVFRLRIPLLDVSFDDTPEGVDGEAPTTSTGIEFVEGVSGRGVKLDGADTLHYTPANNIDLSSGTVELWVKPLWDEATAPDDHRFLVAATEEYLKNELRLYRLGGEGLHVIQFTLVDGKGKSAGIKGSIEGWASDEWHHVAATWDVRGVGDGQMKLYIDGALAGESTGLSLSMGDAALPLRIGAEYLDRFQPNAVIDELRILNYPLLAVEVGVRYSIFKDVDDTCPDGMAFVSSCGGYCIDQYEAFNDGGKAGSAADRDPWVEVDWLMARAACEAAGKHLCSSAEWMAACNLAGERFHLTVEESGETYSCNTDRECGEGPCKTGASTECKSDRNVFDMIGNVMEWTSDRVTSLDQCGSGGPVGAFLGEDNDKYGGESFWNQPPSCKVGNPFLRGGVYYDRHNAGCFTLGLHKEASLKHNAYGFRCCSGRAGMRLRDGSFWDVECHDGTDPLAPSVAAPYQYQATLGTGSAGSSSGQFSAPISVAVDSSGDIYVTDQGNSRVQVFDSSGQYSRTIGTGAGSGEGQFTQPYEVFYHSLGLIETIYVTDFNHRVQVFDTDGTYKATIGGNGVGKGDDQFNGPTGVGADGLGYIHVVDGSNSRVQVFKPDHLYAATIGEGTPGNGRYQFRYPYSIAFNSTGYIFLSDAGNDRIQVLRPDRTYTYTIGGHGEGSANNQFGTPYGIAIDAGDMIFIADGLNHRVQVFNPDGTYNSTLGGKGKGSGNDQFNMPMDVSIGYDERIHVADRDNHRVLVFCCAAKHEPPIVTVPVSSATPTPEAPMAMTPSPSSQATTAPSTTPQVGEAPTPTPGASTGPSATPTASAEPITEPTGNTTATPATTPAPVEGSPTPVTSGTPILAPTVTTAPTPPVSPAGTAIPLLDNGQPCTASGECQSSNCGGGVCCIPGMACCDADADCPPDHRCEGERFYCMPGTDESKGEKARERLAELQAQVVTVRQDAPEVELATVETLISQANEKLMAGDYAEAYRLSVDAMSTLEEVRKGITKPIGEACTENAECETGNCQNRVCCKPGELCCSSDAHCKEDQRCNTDRSYCVSKGDEKAGMTLQERIADALTDPQQLVAIVAAIVVGLGFGLYQLRGRIWEAKREKELNALQHQVQQMQYQGPGGQWQQPPQQWKPPQGGWGT